MDSRAEQFLAPAKRGERWIGEAETVRGLMSVV